MFTGIITDIGIIKKKPPIKKASSFAILSLRINLKNLLSLFE